MAGAQKTDPKDTAPKDLGRYRLHGEIASGGMGAVYFGRLVGTAGFAKTVAIKSLHAQFAKIPEFVAMFLAEARLAARIRHPNVAQTLDVLEIEDEIYLVLEYIDGESLSRLIRAALARHERLPLDVAVTIMAGVLHGLHAAHEAKNDRGEQLNIVHRDISPQNILVGIDGVPRVIDFGIAKAADNVQITREGELKGKLSYMAPEQLSGGKVSRKVDIYAASVVLWELLTGQRLFDADYQSAILKNILHRPTEPPSHISPEVPPELDAIVLRGLAREPGERFTTAREMALALEERIVLANPSYVGAWVESVASESLKRRAIRIAQIEGVQSGPPETPEEIMSDMIVVETRTKTEEAPRSRRRAVAEPAPVSQRAAAPPSQREGAPRSSSAARQTPAPPPSARPSSPPRAPVPGGVGSIGPLLPPPTITVEEKSAVAPAWPVPGIGVAPAGMETLPAAAKKRSQGGGTLLFLLLIVAAVGGFYFVVPELMKRSYVSSAARDGLTLSIDRVELSFEAIHLRGVAISAVDVPGVTLRAAGVDLVLQRLDPVELTLHDATASVDGSYPQIHDALVRWTAAHASPEDGHRALLRVVLESGKILWSRPFGEATRLDAENVTGTLARSTPEASLGEDVEVSAPLAYVTTAAGGKMGPWRVKWRRQASSSLVNVLLDPVSGAQANIAIGTNGILSVDVALPHVSATALGLGPSAFGRRPEDALALEGMIKLAAPSASRVTAEMHLVLAGARVTGAAAAADAEIDGRLDGDPSQPLEVRDGSFVLGPFRGKLGGTLTLAPAFLKGDLSWKTPQRCPASDQLVGGTVRFDTRSIDNASVLPSPKCGLRILPP